LLAAAIYAASGLSETIARADGSANRRLLSALFMPLSVYGGYFGGGNSFLVLALLGVSGHNAKLSGEIKNVLIAAVNFGAVFVFASSALVNWPVAISLGAGGIVGSLAGMRLFHHLPVAVVRAIVIGGGLLLAGWMFAT
jgi:uncharacterized protein